MDQIDLNNNQEALERQTELAEAAQIRYLTPENTQFIKTKGQILSAQVDGVVYPEVFLHCSFPHTNKTIFISVRTIENQEVGMIKSLELFPEDTMQLLEEQIEMRYFAPSIKQVVHIKEEFGYSYWDTETSAGSCRFTVRSGGANVKVLANNKLLIMDVDGNRFIIEDLNQLSDKEYRMVEMCIS